jgi:hypothetical protein
MYTGFDPPFSEDDCEDLHHLPLLLGHHPGVAEQISAACGGELIEVKPREELQ